MELKSKRKDCVRKNLFGPVDPDHLQLDFQRMLYASMEEAKQRWNFDFLQETPAEGLLQWEELQDHQVPAFYRARVVGEARQPLQPMNRTVATKARAPHTGREKPAAKRRPKKKSLAGKRRRDTVLTDHYTARKKQIRMDLHTPVKKLAF